MTIVIKNDGEAVALTPGAARRMVQAGEAQYPTFKLCGKGGQYVTREMVAEKPKKTRGRPKKKVIKPEPEESGDEAE
jgi:hypothetical protein